MTATVDHLLTDQLMVRGEVRWDTISKDSGANDGEFFHGTSTTVGPTSASRATRSSLGAEVIYNFNKFGGE